MVFTNVNDHIIDIPITKIKIYPRLQMRYNEVWWNESPIKVKREPSALFMTHLLYMSSALKYKPCCKCKYHTRCQVQKCDLSNIVSNFNHWLPVLTTWRIFFFMHSWKSQNSIISYLHFLWPWWPQKSCPLWSQSTKLKLGATGQDRALLYVLLFSNPKII